MTTFRVGLRFKSEWAAWHAQLDASPEYRAALAEVAELRKQARINAQLAAAVPCNTGYFYAKDISGRWVKRDKPAAAWSKSLKRRYRETFAQADQGGTSQNSFRVSEADQGQA